MLKNLQNIDSLSTFSTASETQKTCKASTRPRFKLHTSRHSTDGSFLDFNSPSKKLKSCSWTSSQTCWDTTKWHNPCSSCKIQPNTSWSHFPETTQAKYWEAKRTNWSMLSFETENKSGRAWSYQSTVAIWRSWWRTESRRWCMLWTLYDASFLHHYSTICIILCINSSLKNWDTISNRKFSPRANASKKNAITITAKHSMALDCSQSAWLARRVICWWSRKRENFGYCTWRWVLLSGRISISLKV